MPFDVPPGSADKNTLILASKSPRRLELMQMLGLPFAVVVSDVDEAVEPGLSPDAIVAELSRRKCAAVAAGWRENIVIGADTIVWNAADTGREMYGKPADHDDAVRMLTALSGRTHQVYTGVTVMQSDKTLTRAVRTDVHFRDLSIGEIERYIADCPPYDKAGAYAIQERAALFTTGITGCFYNVIGLPVPALALMLREFGADV